MQANGARERPVSGQGFRSARGRRRAAQDAQLRTRDSGRGRGNSFARVSGGSMSRRLTKRPLAAILLVSFVALMSVHWAWARDHRRGKKHKPAEPAAAQQDADTRSDLRLAAPGAKHLAPFDQQIAFNILDMINEGRQTFRF